MKKIDRPAADSDTKNPTPPQAVQKNGPRWNAVHEIRLPHKVGTPLGSTSCASDGAIR
jgi:hypothetical protein